MFYDSEASPRYQVIIDLTVEVHKTDTDDVEILDSEGIPNKDLVHVGWEELVDEWDIRELATECDLFQTWSLGDVYTLTCKAFVEEYTTYDHYSGATEGHRDIWYEDVKYKFKENLPDLSSD